MNRFDCGSKNCQPSEKFSGVQVLARFVLDRERDFEYRAFARALERLDIGAH